MTPRKTSLDTLPALELRGDINDMRARAMLVSVFFSFSSPSLLPLLVPLALRMASVFLFSSDKIVPARSPLPLLGGGADERCCCCCCLDKVVSPCCLGTLNDGTSSTPLDAVLAGEPSSSVTVPFFPPVSLRHFVLLGANLHL